MIRRGLEILASGNFALVLLAVVIILCVMGAVLPQATRFTQTELIDWQARHEIVTAVARPLGFFHVFRGWPFLTAIVLLAANTLACTILHLIEKNGIRNLSRIELLRRVGFVTLHLALILTFGGGFLSAAADLDGRILLTEGQSFTDAPENFLHIDEGPLRRARHSGATLRLKRVDVEYAREHFRVGVTSELEMLAGDKIIGTGAVKINEPLPYEGLSYMYDNDGFSPRLIIRDSRNGRVMDDSFIALATVRLGKEREYRDFLPLPFLDQKIVVRLYPSFERVDGEIRHAGDKLTEPMLVITAETDSGEVVERRNLAVGGRTTLGRYVYECPELRRWASFRVGHDPGYPVVCAALWLAVIALLMRYLPDVRSWVRDWSIIPSDAVAAPRDAPVVPPTS